MPGEASAEENALIDKSSQDGSFISDEELADLNQRRIQRGEDPLEVEP